MLDRLKAKVHRMTAPSQNKTTAEKETPSPPGIHHRRLTQEDLESGRHHNWVGGMWEEIGNLQFDFLKARGLLPRHKLLDVGCGSLRGGIHFIRYLDAGNYHGIDINPAALEAGEWEIEQTSLAGKAPNLLANSDFEVGRFGESFDFALAQSLFTHLDLNHIIRCLVEVEKVIEEDGVFFATFFEAPSNAHLEDMNHDPGGVTTHYDADPFHYSASEMEWAASLAGLSVEYIGDWEHPRNQRMLALSKVRKL